MHEFTGTLPNPQRRRGQYALNAMRSMLSKIVFFVFKRLKKMLSKQLATMPSSKKTLVTLHVSLCTLLYGLQLLRRNDCILWGS
jgi:hypothetical protein